VSSVSRQRLELVDAGLRAPGIAVRGEIDVATLPHLEQALDTAIQSSSGAFVLDLTDVEFVDSSGVHALLRARALLAREDRALAVVCPPGAARRVIDVAGIADLLFLYRSREDAAAALVPRDRG
jgi:anti-sigma B factor antagonist